MAKKSANVNTLRRIIRDKEVKHRGSMMSWQEARREAARRNDSVVKKLSKEALLEITYAALSNQGMEQFFKKHNLLTADDIVDEQLKPVSEKFRDLNAKLDAIEVMQAVGEDPSPELKAIAEAIAKL